MFRKLMGLFVAVGLMTAVGCDSASSTATKAKETAKEVAKDAKDGAKDLAKDAKDTAKGVLEAGKEQLAKLTELMNKELPAIETKINGLSGDSKTKASEALTALKKMIEDAKATVSDPAKWKEAWEAITAKIAELKKQIGL